MTPKEKAEDLLYQMRYDHMDGILTKKKAKRCAKIAVDEILSELAYTQNYVEDNMNKIRIYISYWQEVKQEIDAL